MAERPEAARIALPRTPSSVGTARRFIAARTAAWSFPEPAAGQLVLIGSELVTNAVLHARTPAMDRLWADYPHATLLTSGEDVGLPAGQMGNSEVGHTNIGAGFVVYQWLTRIDREIAEGRFSHNEALLGAMAAAQRPGARRTRAAA